MSFLQALFGRKAQAPRKAARAALSGAVETGPETGPVKMTLEERMAFRRELLYEAIRTTLAAHGLSSSQYRIRVVRNDKRGHQYAVMMDLSVAFLSNPEGRPPRLHAMGGDIARNAMERYGLHVSGVFWRVNEKLRAAQPPVPPAADSVQSAPSTGMGNVAREELAAFEAAWRNASSFPVGSRVYSTDLSPLEPLRGDGEPDGGR